MGCLVGIDYGEKRTGIAYTDPDKIIATGLKTILTKDLIKFLEVYFQTVEVETLIIGEPIQKDGKPSNVETKIKDFIFHEFLKKNKNLDHKKFKNDFDILSVLRNFKIIGIFTRLSMRDNKNKYLKLIPYAWKLIELRTSKNAIFKDLNYLLVKNFDKKKRKLI